MPPWVDCEGAATVRRIAAVRTDSGPRIPKPWGLYAQAGIATINGLVELWQQGDEVSIENQDPAGSWLVRKAVPTPTGAWAYILDDWGVQYRSGRWPFARKGEPTSVRVCPDTEFRIWRNEAVDVIPGRASSGGGGFADMYAHAQLNLWVRSAGDGGSAVVCPVSVELDLEDKTARIVGACPDRLAPQARLKASKLLELVLEHREIAATGDRIGPATAHERFLDHYCSADVR